MQRREGNRTVRRLEVVQTQREVTARFIVSGRAVIVRIVARSAVTSLDESNVAVRADTNNKERRCNRRPRDGNRCGQFAKACPENVHQ